MSGKEKRKKTRKAETDILVYNWKQKHCYHNLYDVLFMHSQSQVIKQFPSLKPFPNLHKKRGRPKELLQHLKGFIKTLMDAQLY